MTSRPSLRSKALLLLLFILGCPAFRALGTGSSLVPPMGWSSWYALGYFENETNVYQLAQMVATNGMKAAGYSYIEISDGWWARGYRQNGMLVGNTNFPGGISNLVWKIHQLGLKVTFYCLAGIQSSNYCDGIQGIETNVANTIASWGVEAVKFDLSCGGGTLANAQPYYQALMATNPNIVINSGTGQYQSWYPQWLNTARIYTDLSGICGVNCWAGVLQEADALSGYASVVRPGYFNDADYLQLGLTYAPDMSSDEKRSHFSLWCILAAPLIASCNGFVSAADVSLMCSPELIAIDQDAGAHGGYKIWNHTGLEVWKKQLGSTINTNAVLLLNRTDSTNSITVNFTDVNLQPGSVFVRDSYARQNLGTYSTSFTATNLPPHASAIYVMSGTGIPFGNQLVFHR